MPIADTGKYRNLVFTWNNYPEDWREALPAALTPFSYLVAGRETAPTTGTQHLQGYVEFKNPRGGRALKSKLPTVWFDPRRGTALQASEYCKKDDEEPLESGTISNQGKRSDIESVRDALQEDGATMRDIVSTATSMQAVKFAQTYLGYHEATRNWRPKVYWLCGAAGTGKSALAHAMAKRLDIDLHVQVDTGKWWDGYDAHKGVLLDDVRDTFCTFNRMLNLLDRYACRIEIKGGSRQLLATHIWVTSPVPPYEIWSNDEEMMQLTRRIDHIWEIKSWDNVINLQGPDDALPTLSQEEWFPSVPQEDNEDNTSETDSVESGETVRA